MSADRSEFGRRQAEMTAKWYEGVKARVGNVEDYIATRHEAYLGRWKESSRFISPGAKLLDIGGGNLFPSLINYIKSLNIDYHYIDVDAEAAAASTKLAVEMGFDEKKFACGLNDKLNYPDSYFDVVFSSHCIEHSIDLESTFNELNRILTNDGFLLMAVPLGWEENPEHPYFFSPEQWVTLVEDSGFEARIMQLGREYPENGLDCFIAAKKINQVSNTRRIVPKNHQKSVFKFYPCNHSTVSYTGDQQILDGGVASHMRGEDWSINISTERASKLILPIFLRHNWSGKILITNDDNSSYHDLYSWFSYIQPCIHTSDINSTNIFSIKPVGKNTSSNSTEGVFYGYMLL